MRSWLFLSLILVSACAGRETERVLAHSNGLPPAVRVSDVPFFPQVDKACGPASLAMVLTWSGLPSDPEATSTQVYTPGREGSLATDMLAGARRNGRLAIPVAGIGEVLAELAAGHPVLVLQNLGLDIHPVWHFAVAVGYDLGERQVVLHSGIKSEMRMSLDTFEHTWDRADRWAIVVLPPDRLPATAGRRAVVEAAAGLERAGLPEAATQAYEAALARWPQDLAVGLGLGNSRYAAGDLEAAVNAFRAAAAANPEAAPAWNNLAHVLLELGRNSEARAAATRAAALAPGDATIRATLAEAETD